MALTYAVEHITGAAMNVAAGDERAARLQRAWTDNVQMLWMTRCLPEPLNERFRALWTKYTAPSDDRHNTIMREMGSNELDQMAVDILTLAFAIVAADARGETPPS